MIYFELDLKRNDFGRGFYAYGRLMIFKTQTSINNKKAMKNYDYHHCI